MSTFSFDLQHPATASAVSRDLPAPQQRLEPLAQFPRGTTEQAPHIGHEANNSIRLFPEWPHVSFYRLLSDPGRACDLLALDKASLSSMDCPSIIPLTVSIISSDRSRRLRPIRLGPS